MYDLISEEIMSEDNNNIDKKKPGRKSKLEMSNLGDISILEYPNRTLPKLIEELLEKEFTVLLSADGYYVSGFYGLNPKTDKAGFAFAQDTSEANVLAFEDAKGYKHIVRSFTDLVHFHSLVWSQFYKDDEYKKPNPKWLVHMLELGAVNITPGAK